MERNQMANAIGIRPYDGHLEPFEKAITLSNIKLYTLSRLERLTGLPQILIHRGIKSGTIKVVD